jgi:uncharacterized integral membrane protein (TIGR00698 family)
MRKILFIGGLILSGSGRLSPPVALAIGIAYGFSFEHPFHARARQGSRILLQLSVVALGFGMNLHQVLEAGRAGFLYTAVGITAALLLGWLLGKLLGVKATTSYLISTGTAICGGSAIAAISPITEANEEEIAVSLGTIFILNSIALMLFPYIGSRMHLSQTQFGLWSALAIHDTSSVVGAAARFGALALAVGTTVKLARALWIVPLSFVTAAVKKSDTRVHWPWFILFFVLAAFGNTWLHNLHTTFTVLKHGGVLGLTMTLYLIGTGLSMKTVRQVGPRPLLQGVLLWIAVASTSLALIRAGIVHL